MRAVCAGVILLLLVACGGGGAPPSPPPICPNAPNPATGPGGQIGTDDRGCPMDFRKPIARPYHNDTEMKRENQMGLPAATALGEAKLALSEDRQERLEFAGPHELSMRSLGQDASPSREPTGMLRTFVVSR